MPFISLIVLVIDGRVPQLKEIYIKEIKRKWSNKEIMVIFSKRDLIPTPKLKNSFDFRKHSYKKSILKLVDSKMKSISLSPKESTNSLIIMGGANSGKSSLVNLLMGKRKVKKSPEAGTTRNITRHKIPSTSLLVYDSPGIFPSSLNKELKVLFKLLNFLPASEDGNENVGEWAFKYLLEKYPIKLRELLNWSVTKEELVDLSYDSFLQLLSKRYKLLEAGGNISLELAERKFLKLIRNGNIKSLYWFA